MARVRPGEAANPAPPTVARVRLRFAKRGRLRFLSHRDVARSFERAVRRAGLPVAHSHGFSPHPRLSWVGAAPTGAASEAEYVEIGLTEAVEPGGGGERAGRRPPRRPRRARRGAPRAAPRWPTASTRAAGPSSCPASRPTALRSALSALLARESVVVERVTPSGRQADRRARRARRRAGERRWRLDAGIDVCAILTAVVRQTTPAVRPDDVLGALDVVADLRPPVPPKATRTAQGLLDDGGALADPLGPDRVTTRA